jgi:IclR family pca regulon transcriptional regulator
MGRVLLAGLPDSELDRYLKEAPLHRLTNSAIVDRDSLRKQILMAREKGYAWIDGELDESICGLAIAVKTMEGKVRGAINVILPSETMDEAEAVEKYLTPLRNAAAQIRTAI